MVLIVIRIIAAMVLLQPEIQHDPIGEPQGFSGMKTALRG
jgi:hypothetical protein